METRKKRSLDAQRKRAQEAHIQELAASKGLTVDQLSCRLLSDLAAGVPDEGTMNILAGMYAACERVTDQ